ncbi:aspartyl protease family protein [Hoeflea marina]|uniref:Aspartyl protease family protein n=1 Tax=Hoeflea marina TaxID=274592 RepID=A0A317PSR1_9HYPH|nr:TIGR02281 family clan AA aspartic protease [Hoeflea marina]PWW04521.1 aspartyl protease family protein [Hoeflea marina]
MRLGLPFILALICGALALLLYNNEAGRTFGMANDEFANVAYLGILGAVIASGVVGSHRTLGALVRNLLVWLIIILGLVTGWTYRDRLTDVAATVTTGLVPGRPVVLSSAADGDGLAISIGKSRGGHFEADAMVNGVPVHFLIDTGATTIALSHEDAMAAGFSEKELRYTSPISTANGMSMAAPVRIDRLEIGPLGRAGLRAMVSKPGALDRSLLGMNFLSTLSSFEMRRDEIVLRD